MDAVDSVEISPVRQCQIPSSDSGIFKDMHRQSIYRKRGSPVLGACQSCRERHLKCNYGTPCSRCTLDERECNYIESRRGRRPPKEARKIASLAEQIPTCSTASQSSLMVGTLGSPLSLENGIMMAPVPSLDPFCVMPTIMPGYNDHTAIDYAGLRSQEWQESLRYIYDSPTFRSEPLLPVTSILSSPKAEFITTSVCIDIYYHFFHNTHPILLPRKYLLEQMEQGLLPYRLECAIKLNSSFFTDKVVTGTFGDTLDNIFNDNTTRDAHTVQAMLLFAIGLHANGILQQSVHFMRLAGEIAIELGMHRKEFAMTHGEGCSVLEESLRRTWWEVYTMDGIMAGVCPVHTFDLYDIESDVPLPCDESEYSSGNIPKPSSLEDLDNAAFSFNEKEFSSFAYRIDTIRTLGKILKMQYTDLLDKDYINSVDTTLVSWSLQLPKSKREVIGRDGQVDEILLQAHLINKICAILLHLPFSDLEFLSARTITVCTPNLRPYTGPSSNSHTARTLQSASDIYDLVRPLKNMKRHSHFMVCIVTLASLIHISSWVVTGEKDEVARQHVRLSIGLMKRFAEVWPIAMAVLDQVKNVVTEISTRTSEDLSTSGDLPSK